MGAMGSHLNIEYLGVEAAAGVESTHLAMGRRGLGVFWPSVKCRWLGRANGLFPACFVVEPQRTPWAPGYPVPPNPLGFSAFDSIPQAGWPLRCRRRPGPRDSRPARRSGCIPAWPVGADADCAENQGFEMHVGREN